MIQLKDVIHFYLGCKVEYEGVINGKELKAEIEANKHDIFYIPKVEKVIGKKIGFLRRIYQLADGSRRYRIGRKGLQTHYSTAKFKPLLRPLSSMTEAEGRQLQDYMWGGFQDAWEALPELLKMFQYPWDSEYRPAFPVYVKAINWLRLKGFDCDELIPAGLAINAEKGGER